VPTLPPNGGHGRCAPFAHPTTLPHSHAKASPMTDTPDHALQRSPWRSVWLHPGDTIAGILASNPRRHVFWLAALWGMAAMVFLLANSRLPIDLFDRRIVPGVLILGAMLGVVSLYVYGILFRLTGKLLGGHGSVTEIRAAIAWSAVPMIAGSAIYAGALLISHLWSSQALPRQVSTVLTGVLWIATALALWSLVAMLFMFRRLQRFGVLRAATNVFLGYICLLLAAAILALLLKTFLFQLFSIPSGTMQPTLLTDDYIVVSKFSYGYSRYSLPFSLPQFRGRVLAREPQRGDVVVFRLPKDDSISYVKRLVGVPGDRIQMNGGLLYINDTPVKQERTEDFVATGDGKTLSIKTWRETLPNGVSYMTLDRDPNGFYDNTPVYKVPPGHYFVLGDDRDNSTDSRVLSQIGYVPFENLVGRVVIIYFSIERSSHGREATLRFERIGLTVR
jgi:signal peptidase I